MRRLPAILILAALLATSCNESGVAAIRIELKPDFSGSVTTSSLHVPESPGPLEAKVRGVEWRERAVLQCARGEFKELSRLAICDIEFDAGVAPKGPSYLRVVLPRGETAAWPNCLTPPRADRQRVARTFDPDNRLGNATSTLTIEVELPGKVIGHGVKPAARGLTSTASRNRATLTIPVDRGTTSGDAFRWDVTWE